MKQRWLRFISTLSFLLLPTLLMAEESESLTFTPPASDQSVVYLENLFGVVDGVLHGTGSQMMGTMFSIFNAAVLALGGIVMMYIILVSTMNTAHEGQMLGQKWSSIWVPLRATIGLALLVPKSSGYCMMQIFVMWVVLQGIGVADKVWSAALDYLNMGGVIIQANMDPQTSSTADNGAIAHGAGVILYGQVCMYALQTQLENQRDAYLSAEENNSGPCSGTPSTEMQDFCDNSVPDFLSTVDPVATYNDNPDANPFTTPMPNFDAYSTYNKLNGVCGTIQWLPMSESDMDSIDENVDSISDSDLETIKQSRAAAIEQMYITLTTTSRYMVDNDPQINTSSSSSDTSGNASKVGEEQFGVALTSSQAVCSTSNSDCPDWGKTTTIDASVLLTGTELQDAIADYNAVMQPALKLIEDAKDSDTANDERAFIEDAEERGWIFAGSYFFDLSRLNGNATENANNTDSGSGLDQSSFVVTNMTNAFGSSVCQTTYANLCTYFNKDKTYIDYIISLLDGSPYITAVPQPDLKASSFDVIEGTESVTVYGYANNAMMIDLAEQEGTSSGIGNLTLTKPDFSGAGGLTAPSLSFGCYKNAFFGCWISDMFNTLYNSLMKPLFQLLLDNLEMALKKMYEVMVEYPMIGFTYIFQEGVQVIASEGVNPIVALAQMGTTYINFAMNAWVAVLTVVSLVGAIAPFLLFFFAVAAPLFATWVSVTLSIGMLTAYYVPFLPYMIFTFGSIAWFIAVIEAMVAAPLVALGVAHPEGHDALGKSEQGLMILLNVFLRPSMMIVGYIAGIALSFVGVWVMNAGFEHVLTYLQGGDMWGATSTTSPIPWASIFGYFFGCLVYTTMYLTITQKAFTLIGVLPDKVLRWIGGQPEGAGEASMQWTEESKGQVKDAGKEQADSAMQMQKKISSTAGEGLGTVAKKVFGGGGGKGGDVKGEGTKGGDKGGT